MIQKLRKGNATINVGYLNRGYSTLHARDFTLEASDARIVLSIDLSPNQRVRNKDSHCYHDITSLIENIERVKYFELYPDTWLKPLAASVGQHSRASHELEIRFKVEPSHTYRGELQWKSASNVMFFVERGQAKEKATR